MSSLLLFAFLLGPVSIQAGVKKINVRHQNSFLATIIDHLLDLKPLAKPQNPERGSSEGSRSEEIAHTPDRLSLYENAEKILILSDSSHHQGTLTQDDLALGENLVSKGLISQAAQVYSTSIAFPRFFSFPFLDKRIHYQRIDNKRTFPFPDDQFDLTILRRGLCYCSDGEENCAGINLFTEEGYRFFHQIVRTLNKRNQELIGYFQGFFRGRILQTEHYPQNWTSDEVIGRERLGEEALERRHFVRQRSLSSHARSALYK